MFNHSYLLILTSLPSSNRLLTPPGTPLVPAFDGKESQAGLMAPRSGPLNRSVSTAKASRVCQSALLCHTSYIYCVDYFLVLSLLFLLNLTCYFYLIYFGLLSEPS